MYSLMRLESFFSISRYFMLLLSLYISFLFYSSFWVLSLWGELAEVFLPVVFLLARFLV